VLESDLIVGAAAFAPALSCLLMRPMRSLR
jgi:hypothetical protein